MMKTCSFLILLSLSFTCCRSLIRTVPVNSGGNPGIISLKNVALSVESTICMEVRIQQFYQATSYRDQKGYVHPDQFILASEGYGYLKTVPAFDCNDFYPGCEAEGKSVIGEQWEYGKVFLILQEMTKSTHVIPAWKPGTMTKLCFTRNESILEVYYDGEKVYQTTDVKIMEGVNTNINLMNSWQLLMPVDGDLYNFDIWKRFLAPNEIKDWSSCNTSKQGNLLKWNDIINKAKTNCNYLKLFLADM